MSKGDMLIEIDKLEEKFVEDLRKMMKRKYRIRAAYFVRLFKDSLIRHLKVYWDVR